MSALRRERNNLREALRGMVDWHKDCGCHGCKYGQSVLADSGTKSHAGCDKPDPNKCSMCLKPVDECSATIGGPCG